MTSSLFGASVFLSFFGLISGEGGGGEREEARRAVSKANSRSFAAATAKSPLALGDAGGLSAAPAAMFSSVAIGGRAAPSATD